MKGILTVKFIDEKTKQIVKEVTKENLVTDAYKNIFSSFINYWSQVKNNGVSNNETSAPYFFNFNESFAKLFFGGILVFNDNIIDATPQHIIPTDADVEKYVGCANLNASPSGSTMKGTFNNVLSEFTTEYAKFVWDWSASQIYNKPIGAFCLTSNLGGQHGLGDDAQDTVRGRSFVPVGLYRMWETANTQTRALNGGTEALAILSANTSNPYTYDCVYEDAENNKIYIASLVRETTLRVRELDTTKFNINLNYMADYGKVDATLETVYTLSQNNISLSSGYGLKVLNNSPNMYGVKDNWSSDATRGKIWCINILDGTETAYNPLHADFISAVANWNGTNNARSCIIEESGTPYMYAYAFNSGNDTLRVWKYNISTQTFTYADTVLTQTQITMLSLSSGSFVLPQGILGKPYISSKSVINNTYNFFRIKDDLTLEAVPRYELNDENDRIKILESSILKAPLMQTQGTSTRGLFRPIVDVTFFSTICNLDTPLTKPATATMQVTYTLYNN